MIYLIGGVPGLRKTTIIDPYFQLKKRAASISTDIIRAYIKELFIKTGGNPQELPSPYPEELRPNDDVLGWIGATDLIRLLNNQQKEVFIEGIALPPTGIRDLELQNPNLKIKAAFVGYSKLMEFQSPEWTPELEKLIEALAGKRFLEYCKNRDWVYKRDEHGNPNMDPYNGSEEAERIRNAVERIQASGSQNFKYFDLINYIPPERNNKEIAKVQLEDHVKVAIEVTSFLLE